MQRRIRQTYPVPLDIDYADRPFVCCQHSSHSDNQNNSDHKCIVRDRVGCWSINHTTKERHDAIRKYQSIGQLITFVKDEDNRADNYDCQLADALEISTAKTVEIHFKDNNDKNSNGAVYSRLVHIDDNNNHAVFTVLLQSTRNIHTLTCKPRTSC